MKLLNEKFTSIFLSLYSLNSLIIISVVPQIFYRGLIVVSVFLSMCTEPPNYVHIVKRKKQQAFQGWYLIILSGPSSSLLRVNIYLLVLKKLRRVCN